MLRANRPGSARQPRLLARHAAPTDLFSPDAWHLLMEKLPERVAFCQQRLCGFTGWFYRDDSEPFWGPATTRCCSGTALRGLWIWKPQGYSLRDLLGMEVERAARLMVEAQPGHSWAEGLVALLGTLRRIGQVYRELRWRCGERRALRHLADLLFTLPP